MKKEVAYHMTNKERKAFIKELLRVGKHILDTNKYQIHKGAK